MNTVPLGEIKFLPTAEKHKALQELYARYNSYDKVAALTSIGHSTVAYAVSASNKAQAAIRNKRTKVARNKAHKLEKTSKGCIDCGYSLNAEALDYDHEKDTEIKLFTIGQGHRNKSQKLVNAEKAKCVIRCSNCHRYKTYREENNLDDLKARTYTYSPELLAEYMSNIESKTKDPSFKLPYKTREYIYDMISMIKESQPCTDCNTFHRFFAMDYDHVRGKKVADLSRMLKKANTDYLSVIFEEIAKCDLVCSNCHRVRTASRRAKKN